LHLAQKLKPVVDLGFHGSAEPKKYGNPKIFDVFCSEESSRLLKFCPQFGAPQARK